MLISRNHKRMREMVFDDSEILVGGIHRIDITNLYIV